MDDKKVGITIAPNPKKIRQITIGSRLITLKDDEEITDVLGRVQNSKGNGKPLEGTEVKKIGETETEETK